MARRRSLPFLLLLLLPGATQGQSSGPPPLDCGAGISGLSAQIGAISGAERGTADGYDTVTIVVPDAWTARYFFTPPGHPAHPAIALRTQRKQVTGVWTADSKGCGFGD